MLQILSNHVLGSADAAAPVALANLDVRLDTICGAGAGAGAGDAQTNGSDDKM